jgi:hypothetical protein
MSDSNKNYTVEEFYLSLSREELVNLLTDLMMLKVHCNENNEKFKSTSVFDKVKDQLGL